ncbi:MAG TPA: TRAP transporter large permease subunit [Vicinamibacterales bacterium]|jgi:tripartite ATP-independent transporter DctM subunit
MNIGRPKESRAAFQLAEEATAIAVLAMMTALPLLEIVGRTSGRSVPGSIVLVQHLTLWIAVVGAMLAARAERLLSLPTLRFFSDRWRAPFAIITGGLAAGVTATLLLASLDLVRIEKTAGDVVAWGIPAWVILTVLPVGFAVIAGRLIWHAAATPHGRLLAALGLAIPLLFRSIPQLTDTAVLLPGCFIIIVATAFGLPIFVAIGGAALLLFWVDGTPINAVPGETYRLTTSPMLPAVPLFALSGYLLAEGDASRRLTRLFTALFGWLPGGLAFVTTAVLAFFTPLTGASGVTIVSMGGLLLPVLVQARHSERTALGLVTVSGSIGLFFFPSLPVFLYGFYANQPFERLFLAGLVPGVLLVVVVAAWAAIHGALRGATRTKFETREAVAAIRHAKWELGLPVVVLGSIVSGWATLIEAAAITVAYAFVVECLVHRALHVSRDVPRVTVECATMVGGFMIILSVALGFTNYLIIAETPTKVLSWVQGHVESPIMFLLALNVFLIVVGALMDIYSAIIVVVPLITPVAAAYGIDPIHLGIIFLANMELGYLMPPMGENLFLSSYRFNRSLPEVYRSTLPYTVILLITVLLITYFPSLSLWLIR